MTLKCFECNTGFTLSAAFDSCSKNTCSSITNCDTCRTDSLSSETCFTCKKDAILNLDTNLCDYDQAKHKCSLPKFTHI